MLVSSIHTHTYTCLCKQSAIHIYMHTYIHTDTGRQKICICPTHIRIDMCIVWTVGHTIHTHTHTQNNKTNQFLSCNALCKTSNHAMCFLLYMHTYIHTYIHTYVCVCVYWNFKIYACSQHIYNSPFFKSMSLCAVNGSWSKAPSQ